MAIAFVQEKGIYVTSGTTGVSPTLDSNPTSGSILVLQHGSNAATVTGITGYGVTTWALAKASAFNQYDASIWWGLVDTTPATTGTVTVSGSAFHTVGIAEFSGLDSSGTLQAQNDTDDAGTGTSASTGPITAAASTVPALYFSTLTIGGARTANTPTGSFTALTAVGNTVKCYGAYRIDTPTPSSATSGWTIGNGQWEMSIVAFKGAADAAAAPASTSLRNLRNLRTVGR